MKQLLFFSLALFIHETIDAMHLAASRSIRTLPRINLSSSTSRINAYASPEFLAKYEKIMQQERESFKTICITRYKQRENLKVVAIFAKNFSALFNKRERMLGSQGRILDGSECNTLEAADCKQGIYCYCLDAMNDELQRLEYAIAELRKCENTLEKLRAENSKIWDLRDELVALEGKK